MNLDNIFNIPEDLRQHGLFCTWAYRDRPGAKPAKVPYSPTTGERARVNCPEDFTTLDKALEAFQTGAYNGIGVLIDKNLCAIDIDNCINEVGQISPLATDVVQQMQAYTEVSPSGRGLRLLFLITEPVDQTVYYINNQTYHIEIYTSGTNKYVSLTGNVLIPAQYLEGRSPQLKAVLEKYMRRAKSTLHSTKNKTLQVSLPDTLSTCSLEQLAQVVISKATNAKNGPIFSSLMSGNISNHRGDRSAADLALCNLLAFWTQRNPALIDYIFRRSGLYRDKWDRPTGGRTYGELTIQRAIEGTPKVYSGQLVIASPEKIFCIENEWADIPPDDKGISAEEIIKNLRDYNINFFPVLPGYYSIQKVGGICYEVRSSFAESGKNLGHILETAIVDRSAKGYRQTAK